MFIMNSAIASVGEKLLHIKFALDRMSLMKTLQALNLLDPDVKEELEEISSLVNQARSITITLEEAVKSDRREKRQRYKRNRRARMTTV